MPIYYSPTSQGFYDTDMVNYTSLPEDLVELTKKEHSVFLHEINNNNKKLVLQGNELVLQARELIITWESIRDKRNGLLDSTDYTQVPDYSGDKEAWKNYRQQLRELPQKFKNPEDVIWPKKPN